MSLELPTNPKYHTSAEQKQKSKNAAKLYRYGSPKLRDLLREKCRIRVHEARQNCFQLGRSKALKGLSFNDIVREELAQLEQDIELQEKILQELADELNEWFVEQMEAELTYLTETENHKDVICPVCQKNLLTCDQNNEINRYKCNCGIDFRFVGDMSNLLSTLEQQIKAHELKCSYALSFFTEPSLSAQQLPSTSTTETAHSDNILNAMCTNCDYFCSF